MRLCLCSSVGILVVEKKTWLMCLLRVCDCFSYEACSPEE